jgi:hypothetical protein
LLFCDAAAGVAGEAAAGGASAGAGEFQSVFNRLRKELDGWFACFISIELFSLVSVPAGVGGGFGHNTGLLTNELLNLAHDATFAVLEGTEPVCCGFFFTPSHALTVYHDKERRMGEKVSGCCFRGDDTVEYLDFKVVGKSEKLDFVVLQLITARDCPSHFPIPSIPQKKLLGAQVARLGVGVATSKNAGSKPKELDAGHSFRHTSVHTLGKRHFAYADDSAAGDSGGAVILLGGQATGMHLGGWNHAASSDEFPAEFRAGLETLEADRAAAAGAVGSAVLSYHMLSRQINTGGWALSLLCDEVSNVLRPFIENGAAGSAGASNAAGC